MSFRAGCTTWGSPYFRRTQSRGSQYYLYKPANSSYWALGFSEGGVEEARTRYTSYVIRLLSSGWKEVGTDEKARSIPRPTIRVQAGCRQLATTPTNSFGFYLALSMIPLALFCVVGLWWFVRKSPTSCVQLRQADPLVTWRPQHSSPPNTAIRSELCCPHEPSLRTGEMSSISTPVASSPPSEALPSYSEAVKMAARIQEELQTEELPCYKKAVNM